MKSSGKLCNLALSLTVGKTYKLKVKNTSKKVKWSSNKKSVATVTNKGVVRAKKKGTAIITAKVGKKKYKCKVTVKAKTNAANPKTEQVRTLVNQERNKLGIESLKSNTLLTNAANIRAKEIAELFSHTRPDGTSCFTAISSDYKYRCLGENIAYGYSLSADGVMGLWMNSPGHRSNILNSNFTEIGIGCYESNGYCYWVQMFGSQW